nr:Uma2 family endonuclease [Leptolyngbya ectocarpi]
MPHYGRENWFSASDLNVYYDVNHALWHKRPDWFLSVGVSRLYEGKTLRRSYVTWQEGASTYIVVEFLSPGTERDDLGRFYQSQMPESDNSQTTDKQPPGKLEIYERAIYGCPTTLSTAVTASS